MKKSLIILLCVCIAVCFGGCSSNSNADETSLETKYYEYAQECIESGDIQKAIEALEEGIEKTGSEKLKELLKTLKENEEENADEEEAQTPEEDLTSSDAPTESSSSEPTVSAPKITYLGKTIWSNCDPYGKVTYLFFLGGGDTVDYCDSNYQTITEYKYTFDGNILSLNQGEDIYYFEIISIANENRFGSMTDRILLEGQGFLSGEWKFEGWV